MDITKGVLEVIAPNENTELLVLDRGFREVAYGTSQITVLLEPGIYRVQARLPGAARSEQLVVVEPGQTVPVRDFGPRFKFDSPTPLVGIPSTHEYQRAAAYGQSRTLHVEFGAVLNSRLFLFSRSISARFSVPTFVVRGQGLEVRFPEFGAYDLDGGWLALSLALPAGTYFVEQDVPELGRRGQILFVEENWQTQVFAPWEEFPDFSKAVIHMRRTSWDYLDFDPNNPRQTALDASTEAALEGLARGRLVMTQTALLDFLYAKFDDPIMGLIGAYAMLVADRSEYDDRLRDIVVPNLQGLLPHSTDVALLATLVGGQPYGALQSLESRVTFTEPPLFAIGTERLLDLAANGDVECPPDCPLADIALRLTTGSAWTRWDEGIGVAEAREQLQSALRDRLPHGRFADLSESAARLARELGLPLSIVAQEMSTLVDDDTLRIYNVPKQYPGTSIAEIKGGQTYQITLSPDLDITPEDLAIAWNETPEARTIAEARLIQAEGKQFDATLITEILISVGTAVASTLITDLIKVVIQRLSDKKSVQSSQGTSTHIEQMRMPDGTEMLVVDIDEE